MNSKNKKDQVFIEFNFAILNYFKIQN